MLRVQEICKENGITLQQLAKRLDISYQALYANLSGNPTLSKLQAIASALGVPITELFSDGSAEELNGFVEYKGEVHKIRSIVDLKELIVKAGGELEELPQIPDHENIRGKEYYK